MGPRPTFRIDAFDRYSFLQKELDTFVDYMLKTQQLLDSNPRPSINSIEPWVERLCQASLDCMYEYSNDEDASSKATTQLKTLLEQFVGLIDQLMPWARSEDARFADDLTCYREHALTRHTTLLRNERDRAAIREQIDARVREAPISLASFLFFEE